jgi:hypothetical protein
MEVQDVKLFQGGRNFQDVSSGCEAVPVCLEVPEWKFRM